jgi:transposase
MSLSPKQLQCIGLLATGMSQKLIAESLDLSPRTIQRWQRLPEFCQALGFAQVRQESPQKTAEIAAEVVKDVWSSRDELRAKEIDLLDRMQATLIDALEKEEFNHRCIDRLIKISERRSKLLGLDIRTYHILDALELLLKEKVATKKHAEIVMRNIVNLEQELGQFTLALND